MISNCNDKYCRPAGFSTEEYSAEIDQQVQKIIYVADPMCSWCYGMASELRKLKAYFETQRPNILFTLTVGGLRPGGGDEWNSSFKATLKEHWKQIHEKTGQPFSHKLLEKEKFNYDTEPSCRAVVSARQLNPEKELSFFNAIQHKFYTESEDPTEADFYHSICLNHNIDFTDFLELFFSDEIKELTQREFIMNREWGVTAYPTIIFQKEDDLYAIARGYTSFEALKKQIEKIDNKVVH